MQSVVAQRVAVRCIVWLGCRGFHAQNLVYILEPLSGFFVPWRNPQSFLKAFASF